MTFITKEDYGNSIRERILDEIVEFDESKLDVAQDRAVALMKSHLSSRYDVTAIFSATGSSRNALLVGFAVDIALYELYKLLKPRKYPEHRKDAYKRAMEWLTDVSDSIINPDLPRPESGEKDSVLMGGNTRRDNRI